MKKNKKPNSWVITVAITTFVLSLFFSYVSNTAISNLKVLPGIVILIFVILIGIMFDLIGVAVTIAKEEEFHARASKKIKGSKTAIKLIRNSEKVSNFCADVIGDICGVLSGAISALIAMKITEQFGLNFDLQFLLSALVAALTVGGKALGKSFAKNKCTSIIYAVAKILSIFEK